jgi:hypothetical protein
MTEYINKITELHAFAKKNWIVINEITVTEESDYKNNRVGENMMKDWYEVSLKDFQDTGQQILFGIKVNTIKTF